MQNTDGSTLTNLAGYRTVWGPSPTNMGTAAIQGGEVQIANAGVSTYVVEALRPGMYYFAVRAYSSSGAESADSNSASKTIQEPWRIGSTRSCVTTGGRRIPSLQPPLQKIGGAIAHTGYGLDPALLALAARSGTPADYPAARASRRFCARLSTRCLSSIQATSRFSRTHEMLLTASSRMKGILLSAERPIEQS
jgi:hypothetical protein